jgi:U3 small nucleolar RNA-associated protein 24
MGAGKKSRTQLVRKMIMKEKRMDFKKKREAESYHPADIRTANTHHFKDQLAVAYNKTQVRHEAAYNTQMYLSYNKSLGPPFHVWLDTNFINFSMQNKMEIVESLMDCLLAKAIPCVCDCVMAELEKLGKKFRIALKLARDKRFKRLTCDGKYADDCVVKTVTQNPIYIVATCDQDLKRRIRQIPGIPIMYIKKKRYTIERLPEAFGAPE